MELERSVDQLLSLMSEAPCVELKVCRFAHRPLRVCSFVGKARETLHKKEHLAFKRSHDDSFGMS
jgi:hypothetical protein